MGMAAQTFPSRPATAFKPYWSVPSYKPGVTGPATPPGVNTNAPPSPRTGGRPPAPPSGRFPSWRAVGAAAAVAAGVYAVYRITRDQQGYHDDDMIPAEVSDAVTWTNYTEASDYMTERYGDPYTAWYGALVWWLPSTVVDTHFNPDYQWNWGEYIPNHVQDTQGAEVRVNEYERYRHIYSSEYANDDYYWNGQHWVRWKYEFTLPPNSVDAFPAQGPGTTVRTAPRPSVMPVGDAIPEVDPFGQPEPPPRPRLRPTRSRTQVRTQPRPARQGRNVRDVLAGDRGPRQSSPRNRKPRNPERKVRVGGYKAAYALANALGEVAEITDLLAEASGWKYDRYEKGTYFQQKFRHVWFEGGYAKVDWDEFWAGWQYNQVEDWAYGNFGQAVGQAAEALGLTTSPGWGQTGRAGP